MRATKYPGVKLISTGLYRVRGKFTDPRSGFTKEVNRDVEAESPKEAATIRAKLLEEGVDAANTREPMTVTGFARLWLKSKAGVVARYTLESYTSTLDKHVLPFLGDFYYDQIGFIEVQHWVNRSLKRKGEDGEVYSRRSVEDWFRVFRNMTRDAIAQLDLLRDPTLRVRFPTDPWTDEDAVEADEILTPEEVHGFLAAMKQSRPGAHALSMTLGLTGQRFCHVSALKWGDIDWENQVIRFRRKQVRGEVGPISRKKPAPREVPMLSELAETLRAHQARARWLLERGSGAKRGVGPDDWVFPAKNGELRQPSCLTNAFEAAKLKTGITKRVTPHGLRYFFNDVLRLAGIDSVTARSITGHVTEEMREHYSTVRMDEKRAVMERVAEKLREAKEKSEKAAQVVEKVVEPAKKQKAASRRERKAA